MRKKRLCNCKNASTEIDMQVLFCYYPYHRHLLFLPLFIVGCLVCFFICLGSLFSAREKIFQNIPNFLFFLLLSIFCIVFAKIFYETAHQALCCTVKGIFVLNRKYVKMDCFSWQDTLHVYETKSPQGHYYWVLSRKPLTQQETKYLAGKSSWMLKLNIDGTIVVWNNQSHDAQAFCSVIKNHTRIISHL